MWSVAGIWMICIAIAAIELPHLVLNRMKRELRLFACLLLFGLTVSSLQVLRVPLPNPLDWITDLLQPLSDMTFDFLK